MEEKLKWHFFNLYCMALSDNVFDITEREMLYEIGLKHHISAEQINETIVTANLTPVIPATLEEKVAWLYDLSRMAWADGNIKEEEYVLLKKYVVLFGFEVDNAEQIVDYLLKQVHDQKALDDILKEIDQ